MRSIDIENALHGTRFAQRHGQGQRWEVRGAVARVSSTRRAASKPLAHLAVGLSAIASAGHPFCQP
eukprot:12549094-Alexandrium_andersonii.AAC.1